MESRARSNILAPGSLRALARPRSRPSQLIHSWPVALRGLVPGHSCGGSIRFSRTSSPGPRRCRQDYDALAIGASRVSSFRHQDEVAPLPPKLPPPPEYPPLEEDDEEYDDDEDDDECEELPLDHDDDELE